MKDSYTNNLGLAPAGTSGKATASAFAQIMNLLINALTKLGLLKEDLDYRLVRASMKGRDRRCFGRRICQGDIAVRANQINCIAPQARSTHLLTPWKNVQRQFSVVTHSLDLVRGDSIDVDFASPAKSSDMKCSRLRSSPPSPMANGCLREPPPRLLSR